MELKKHFWFPRLSGVTIATILSVSDGSFLKLSCHMFPCREILKVFKSKIRLDIWNNRFKIPNFSQISEGVWELRASEIEA